MVLNIIPSNYIFGETKYCKIIRFSTSFESHWTAQRVKTDHWLRWTHLVLIVRKYQQWHTSFIRVSVWSISMSSDRFFPRPFVDRGKSLFDWFFREPLPVPAPVMALLWPVGFFTPGPPWPGRRDIPGSSPSHRMSSGEICQNQNIIRQANPTLQVNCFDFE